MVLRSNKVVDCAFNEVKIDYLLYVVWIVGLQEGVW